LDSSEEMWFWGIQMKEILIASAALAGLIGTPALAADLTQPIYKAPPAAPMASSWTGFYIGGTAGGAWASFDPSTTTTFNPVGYLDAANVPAVNAAGQQSIRPSAFTGGLELGYNWQASNFVYGLEGDVESFHLSGSSTSGPVVYPSTLPGGSCPFNCFTVNSAAHTDWLATARGRLGVTAAGNWLFFVTGGAAFTSLNGTFSFTDPITTESGSISSTRVGYTVGGGVEAKLWAHWSVKAEYLFVDFGRVSVNSNNLVGGGFPLPAQVFTHSLDLRADIARVGLNYHF
jgi:outer membrane immunogenic protein